MAINPAGVEPAMGLWRARVFLLVSLLLLVPRLHAQLAITEVMSAPSASSTSGLRGPEYWELTNFGTNEVNLHGYGFRDGVATRPLVRDPFTNLVIRAGESIVFFRVADVKDAVTNAALFRAWWGETNLPPNLQCRIWKSPGLSGWDGDAVVLFDPARRLVDSVQFGRARLGRAFTYEPGTGLFGLFSAAGVNGAFKAPLADDVGSPGSTTGPAPLRFEQQPVDQSVDAGMSAMFVSMVSGLPRPQYQWYAQGSPLLLATAPSLEFTNVQAGAAGAYHVVATNGVAAVTSVVVTLSVNTSPGAPSVITPPLDTTVFEHQTAVFSVLARGLPAPGFQWQLNGLDVPGATSSRFQMPDAGLSLSGTRVSVRIWNSLGATNVSALLTVTRRPDLRFTEVMALPTDEEGSRHFDWFELTNYDTNAIDLTGWRFSDRPSFARAVVIGTPLILQPGESVVFAERLTEQLFADWWGRDNLPAGLKFFSYGGFGLGYLGEQLFLWNGAAIDPNDSLATVSWAAATSGVSFECEHWCDPEGYGCLDEATVESVPGLRGAFRAASAMDVGSPGYVANPPLRILSITRRASGPVDVTCRVTPGRVYRLCRAQAVAAAVWEQVATGTAFSNVMTLVDPSPDAGGAGFYRVEEAQ